MLRTVLTPALQTSLPNGGRTGAHTSSLEVVLTFRQCVVFLFTRLSQEPACRGAWGRSADFSQLHLVLDDLA